MRLAVFLWILLFAVPIARAQPGMCLYFNGQDEMARVAHSPSLALSYFGEFTVEAWVRMDSVMPGKRVLIRKSGTAWELCLMNGNQATFGVFDSSMQTAVSSTILKPGRWHHIAGVYSGREAVVYVDGEPTGSVSTGALSHSPNTDLLIGGDPQQSGEYWRGWMDEVRIWRRALDQEELRNNMYCTLPHPQLQDGLSAYYGFDQSEGCTITDLSGFGNDGLLIPTDTTDTTFYRRQPSTAPLPFISTAHGDFEDSASWHPHQGVPATHWSRVRLAHRIDLNGPASVAELRIDSLAEIDIQPQACLTVTDTVINQRGLLGVIIRSDGSGTGSLLHYSPGIQSTVLRYLEDDMWHYIASPVQNALSGVYTGAWMLPYEEPSGGWGAYIGSVWVPLTPARGFAVYASSGTTGDFTAFIEGNLNQGNISTLPLTNAAQDPLTAGYNLIGNPYPSAIDWEATEGWTRSHVNGAIYTFDPYRQNYQTYVDGSSVNGGSCFIAASQAFFVRVRHDHDSGMVRMDDRVRLHHPNPFLKTSPQTAPSLLLRVISDSSGYADETALTFHGAPSCGFEPMRDATKLFASNNLVPQIWSVSDDTLAFPLAINHLGAYLDSLQVPFGFRPGHSASFTLEVAGSSSLPPTARLSLEDLKTGLLHDLKAFPSIPFLGDPSDSTLRFLLHLDLVGVQGAVSYHNAEHTPLDGTLLSILPGQSGDTVVLTTGEDGSFYHPMADTGHFVLSSSISRPWAAGAVNAMDALLILKAFNQLDTLDSLQNKAADVNDDGTVNAVDALLVAQRFAGLIDSFPAGDWVFDEPGIQVQASDIKGLVIRGLLSGDINRSFRPLPLLGSKPDFH